MEPVRLPSSLFAPLPHPDKLVFSSDVHGVVGSAIRVGAGYLVSDADGTILDTADDTRAAAALAHGA